MQRVIVRRSVPALNLSGIDLHPVLKNIYLTRGVASLDDLERSLQHLTSYQLLTGMDQAVSLLSAALSQQQSIMVVGDFDADGATSVSLAVSALKSFGAKQISYLVPNRFKYGYGLTPEIVDEAAKRQPKLIITVDNGISSMAGVARANELGIQVLVTDHHLAGTELPPAAAIVNPNQPGDLFPSKALAGVGVIFYVMLALRAKLRELNWFAENNIPEPNMGQFLDLVALGTVADVVPLDKNNRILVHQGLLRIRSGKSRPGIQALLTVSGRHYGRVTASDLSFAVGPRLNAAGRLDDMSLGIECLLSDDLNQAQNMAVQLDRLNKERQAIEADMQQQAFKALANLHLDQNLPRGICLFDETWHQGVVGIVASRVKDKYHRPVIAFAAIDAHELKGSARSVTGVHIRDVLDAIATQHPGLVSKFGGHAMAAGISLPRENFAAFSAAFAQEVSCYLNEDDLQGKIYSDGELTIDTLTLEVAKLLREGGPWGQAFPEPLFDNEFIIVEQRLVGERHLKLVLNLPNSTQAIEGIAFNIDTKIWPNYRCKKIRAVYRLDIDEFKGNHRIQVCIEHLEIVSQQ